ncbi:MAG TPA: S8 family serine peptidase [Thermoanaerobaculia bacterium]|nr:S8 family serine peptidase [Thermoanaerobaculia bacterium]
MLGRSTTVALALALLALPLAALPAPPTQRFTPQRLEPDELAQVPRDGSHLLLAGAVFDPTLREPDFSLVGLPSSVDAGYGIVQLRADQLAAKEELASAGVAFVGYLPDNAFSFRITPEATALLAGHPAVRWIGPYKTGYKIHPDLWPGATADTTEITVRVFPDVPLEKVEQELAQRFPAAARLQISDLRAGNVRYGVTAADRFDLVVEAAAIPGVAFVEPYRRPILHNNDALAPVQSNAVSVIAANACAACSIFNHNITGTGQIAAVADSGNDSDACFFRYDATAGSITDAQSPVPPATGTIDPTKKLIAYYVQPGSTAYDSTATCPGGSPISFHGTHTSGTLVGDNFANLSTPTFAGINTGDGMAPNAKLVFQDVGHDTTGCLSGLNDPYGMYLQALNAGARVHSNSYGAATGGEYTGDDAIADRFLFEHEEMAIFFSAGNSGGVAGTPNTIGSPGNAKNVVTVGRVGHGNSTAVVGSSSRGPTDDGRKKPDIMAPGSATISALGDASHVTNNCSTQSLSGTSMSCPTTAGAAVLLRQYFEDGYYPTGTATAADSLRPRAALVKAALLNGTLPLASAGAPNNIFGNNNFGWGRVFLDNDLFFTGDARELRVWNVLNTDGLQTGGSHVYNVAVAAGQELRATLVWMDPEPSPGVAVQLVNNLNLTVTDGTNTYLGNVMSAGTLVSATGGSADVLNNVEQVRLATPLAATHTITVSAPAVPGTGVQYTNRQGYALVVSYAACSTAVAAAPTGLGVANNPPMGTTVSWTNAAGSTNTQVYRAVGTCAGAAAGDFQYVGSSAGTSLIDTRAQGGITYAYKVRGTDTCGEGPASTCVEITPAGTCDLVPNFAGLGTASGGFPDNQSCRVRLAWTAGTASCPAGPTVRYDIYRSTTPNFTPSGGNLLTSVTGVTTYDDEGAGVVNDTTYHYVVRAEDSTTGGPGPNGGNQEPNNVHLFATALGPPGAPGTFSDGAGDGHAYGNPEPPWRIVSALTPHTGTFSYHSGFDGLTTKYAPGVCAAIVTPTLSIAVGSVLSYWVNYNAELQWDGAVVEISTDGGGSWADLPPTTPVGYPSVLVNSGNACNYPVTQGAFTGPSGNAALSGWTQFQTNLAAFAGQTNVKIRWRFASDGGVEFQGFYLDDVQITNVNLPGSCTPTPVELLDLRVQ